ncbi:MAG TPA: hypothetical protein VGZ22_00730 [Isosphaeraceae bacterium]|jgi:hypothetical protein|nr:hypothetical protein [Isosphaeraceae bacterium]
MSLDKKPVAAVITAWRALSHADVIVGRLMEPEAWGHKEPFALEVVSVYADQFPDDELCRATCKRHNVPIFSTINEALSAVPIEGVIIVGEHGDYAANMRGQRMYPRLRLFEGVVQSFRRMRRRVPVFSDKHLSYEWPFARWMVDLARHEGFAFMTGSSLPVAWRVPDLSLPIGCELKEAFALGYADLDAYGFHALETLQCMTERRAGGETGVASVQCLSGKAIWQNDESVWSQDLLEALLPARRQVNPKAMAVTPRDDDTLFLVNYADGLRASVGMFNSVGECFAFAGRRLGTNDADATVFALEPGRPYGHFGYLDRAIERMILTGKPAYPVERTLLTTGILAAALQSRSEAGTVIPTPHLAEIHYQPAEWPHATGAVGTPA